CALPISKNRSGRSRGEINWMLVAEDATQKARASRRCLSRAGFYRRSADMHRLFTPHQAGRRKMPEAYRHVALERPTLYAHARIRAQTPENIRLSASSQMRNQH